MGPNSHLLLARILPFQERQRRKTRGLGWNPHTALKPLRGRKHLERDTNTPLPIVMRAKERIDVLEGEQRWLEARSTEASGGQPMNYKPRTGAAPFQCYVQRRWRDVGGLLLGSE